MESKRDQKRQSAKKQREYSVYSKKAVRAKEALIQKLSPVQPKPADPKAN
jgi:hypothetical protein